MNPRNPESRTSQSKEVLIQGYSVTRIKGFTPAPRTQIREAANDYKDNKTGPEKMSAEDVKRETAALSLMFISQAWKKIQEWVIDNPPGLAMSGTENLTLISESELARVMNGADSKQALERLLVLTMPAFAIIIRRWSAEMEEKIRMGSGDEKEQRWLIAYKRYKEVLGMGMSNVTDSVDDPVETTWQHIAGGMETGRSVITSIFRVLPDVFQTQFGRVPTKEEMRKLIQGAKPLVLAIAQSDIHTFSAISDNIEVQNSRHFKPDVFNVVSQGKNLSLEIRQKILDNVEDQLQMTGHSRMHTGCPALFAEGVRGGNVVSELYEWFYRLYDKYHIQVSPAYQ